MEAINGKVQIPGGYFLKMAKADYNNYRSALWREIYQNSIDAGASVIAVSWDENQRSITILDDGCGMSLETLTEKLLALGGSQKAEGATGAFGKAKELELFSWKEYMLHTKNYLLIGAGDDYQITETEDNVDGCGITIYIQEEEDFGYITRYAKIVAEKIETECQIHIMGVPVECARKKGEFIKKLDIGNIYINKDLGDTSYAIFRMNGIWMFESYIGEHAPHITVELSASSIECMNSNRDGLKGSYLNEAQKYFQRLASDRKSALFPDKEEIRLHAMGREGRKYKITNEDMEFLEKLHGHGTKKALREGLVEFIMNNSPEMLQKLVEMRALANMDAYDFDEYEKLKYFGFRWDTCHKYEKGQETEARKFLDGSEQNAKRAQTLLEIWGETLKQTMLDSGKFHEFSIGFTWNSDAQAQIENKDGELYFFINPKLLQEKYNLKNRTMLGKKLRQLAAHEIAHIKYGFHDEYFMMEMESLQEETWKSEKLYDQICRIKIG